MTGWKVCVLWSFKFYYPLKIVLSFLKCYLYFLKFNYQATFLNFRKKTDFMHHGKLTLLSVIINQKQNMYVTRLMQVWDILFWGRSRNSRDIPVTYCKLSRGRWKGLKLVTLNLSVHSGLRSYEYFTYDFIITHLIIQSLSNS